ncbi:ADP-ribose pyrophosphatase [Sporomusaceae bacterium FL31]|nr:ADP-ribose pyrophosphatase [Sporomusaceae bacterium FL31]GCE33308.1 ADP-ribose pyrophosphatase [Sporomusaceae bacterium]
MNDLIEKFIKSEVVFEGNLLTVRRDTVELPNGKHATRELIQHPGAVAVVPIRNDGKILLVRQFRYPVDQLTLEIPAGKLDLGEEPDACAKRELEEETGYKAKKLRLLSSILTTPGFTNEVIHLYVAEDLVLAEQCPDEDEFIDVEVFTKEEIRKMIENGTICDAKSLLGLLLAGL